MATCEQIQTELSAYLDGEIAAAERGSVEAHVKDCAVCREALKDLEMVRRALADLPKLKAPAALASRVRHGLSHTTSAPQTVATLSFETPRRHSIWRPALIAAAAVVMAGVILFLLLPSAARQEKQVAMAPEMKTPAAAPTTLRDSPAAMRPPPPQESIPEPNGREADLPKVADDERQIAEAKPAYRERILTEEKSKTPSAQSAVKTARQEVARNQDVPSPAAPPHFTAPKPSVLAPVAQERPQTDKIKEFADKQGSTDAAPGAAQIQAPEKLDQYAGASNRVALSDHAETQGAIPQFDDDRDRNKDTSPNSHSAGLGAGELEQSEQGGMAAAPAPRSPAAANLPQSKAAAAEAPKNAADAANRLANGQDRKKAPSADDSASAGSARRALRFASESTETPVRTLRCTRALLPALLAELNKTAADEGAVLTAAQESGTAGKTREAADKKIAIPPAGKPAEKNTDIYSLKTAAQKRSEVLARIDALDRDFQARSVADSLRGEKKEAEGKAEPKTQPNTDAPHSAADAREPGAAQKVDALKKNGEKNIVDGNQNERDLDCVITIRIEIIP